MKTKNSILAVTKVFFIFFMCGLFTSCIESNELPKFKYKVTYGFGNRTVYDYTKGDIIFLRDGLIKYESYNYGHPDTVIVGGTYLIENYR